MSSTSQIHVWRNITFSLLACAATALLATPLLERIAEANIVMLFLLVVVLITVKLGRAAGVTAAFASVALFDVFFVAPRFSFSVNDAQYLVTFAVMLIIALVVSYLTAHLHEQAREAERRAQQSNALYELARLLASSLSLIQVRAAVADFMHNSLELEGILVLPNAAEQLEPPPHLTEVEILMAHTAYESGQIMQTGHHNDGEHASTFLPLFGATRKRGVLVVRSSIKLTDELIHDRPMLEAVASISAASIERLHFVEVAQNAEWQSTSERLRATILSAISHDIRTPLTAVYGMADSLHLIEPPLPDVAQHTATALCAQILQLNQMVSNLLDMAKLQAGGMVLRCEWQPLEEVVGSSLQLLSPILAEHKITVCLADDLPLLYFDAVLLERVLCNLLENAVKYGCDDVTIEANVDGSFARIAVHNSGATIPVNKLDAIFNLFERGVEHQTIAGTGIGLSICRSIVEAHGGQIWAANLDSGVVVSFTLPLGVPPEFNA